MMTDGLLFDGKKKNKQQWGEPTQDKKKAAYFFTYHSHQKMVVY